MTLFAFMFSSIYDQASLAIMAVGLAINAAIDVMRGRRNS